MYFWGISQRVDVAQQNHSNKDEEKSEYVAIATRRPTNWWGSAKRDVHHPTATAITCSELQTFQNRLNHYRDIATRTLPKTNTFMRIAVDRK